MKQHSFRLTPNRSFSREATVLLFVLLAAWVIALAIFSFTHNSWPILGFAGLELAGLAVAFLVHSHKSKIYEEVILTPETVFWKRQLPSGTTQSWQAPLAWTQLNTDAPKDTRSPLTFSFAGHSLDFGHFLNPEDRGSFLEAFTLARQRFLPRSNSGATA